MPTTRFRTGVTGLAIMALVEAEHEVADDQRTAVTSAIDRGENGSSSGCRDSAALRPTRSTTPGAMPTRSRRSCGSTSEQPATPIARPGSRNSPPTQVDMLSRYSFLAGGWGYYDMVAGTQIPGDSSNSFVTATCLIALREAKSIGVDFPERLTKKAIASIHRQQYPDFTYAYGEYLELAPMHLINRPGGSLGRSQVCNLALRLYGDERVTDEVIETWLDRLIARNGWLSIGRKRPIPHESHFYVAGYFYYYGHWYAAQCIELLPAADRPHFQDQLAHITLAAPGKGRQLVGLSVLQLPPAIRHGDGRDDAPALPKSNVVSRARFQPSLFSASQTVKFVTVAQRLKIAWSGRADCRVPSPGFRPSAPAAATWSPAAVT